MKYCKFCNKVFEDEKLYCPQCGSRLENPEKTDIFGEYMGRPKTEDINVSVNNENYILYNESDSNIVKTKVFKIFTYLSFVIMFVPIYGVAFNLITLIYDSSLYKDKKLTIPYVICAIISLIGSIIFQVILYKSGILLNLNN